MQEAWKIVIFTPLPYRCWPAVSSRSSMMYEHADFNVEMLRWI
jgi:hypothetical protein